MMARAQVMMEFIFYVVVAVLVGVLFLALVGSFMRDVGDRQRRIALDDIGYRLQDECVTAESVSDGYSRNITIPSQADRFDYTLANDGQSISLTSGTISLSYRIPSLQGTFQKGRNVLHKDGSLRVVPG